MNTLEQSKEYFEKSLAGVQVTVDASPVVPSVCIHHEEYAAIMYDFGDEGYTCCVYPGTKTTPQIRVMDVPELSVAAVMVECIDVFWRIRRF